METILYFFRDEISGTHYFIYAFICFLFLFAIIGYLFKQKYGKVEFKLGTNSEVPQPTKKELKKAAREAKKKAKKNGAAPVTATTAIAATNAVPVNNRQPQVVLTPQTSQTQTVQQPQAPQTGGLQQPTSLPNLNQTSPVPQTPAPQDSDGIPEVIN